MFASGMNAERQMDGDLAKYILTKEEKALTSQARWYIYSHMRISKQEFESEEFREMLRGQSDGPGIFLTKRQLIEWIGAEFRIFLTFLKYAVRTKHVQAKGNAFGQALHDGGTLKSHQKYQALGAQFIVERADLNLCVCIGLVESNINTDALVASLFEEVTLKRTSLSFEQLFMAVRQDRAAKGVAAQVHLEEECCEMHDGDKIGQSAVGALVRSRNKVVVNPFDDMMSVSL